jgi:hypothetical protein
MMSEEGRQRIAIAIFNGIDKIYESLNPNV